MPRKTKLPLSRNEIEGARELILRLLEVKNDAARLGLWKTFHAIDTATTAIGWEMAERMPR